jgi:AAA+ ATPase superfamily predicted ATPase
MFFGREFELGELEKQYSSNNFEFPVIYGRRRVGKTELISEFIKDKKAIYVQGVIGTPKQNLENIAKAIHQFESESFLSNVQYLDIQATFDDMTKIMQKEKIIFVIDEFPYLASSIPAVSSILQFYIDNQWKKLNSMLILCGSSMSFIEKQVLSYQSPLYGRNITRYKLLPFSFRETTAFLSGVPREDTLGYYAITSGIPYYVNLINTKLSLEENIMNLFLYKNSKLLEEPLNLLNMEVKEPASYLSVLNSIADGSTKHNEIVTKSGLKSPLTSRILENLIELGIVSKKTPMLSSSNKGLYYIKDNLYRFWFTFISKNIDFIETGRSAFIQKIISEQFTHFLGNVFEDVSREWLLDESEKGNLGTYIVEIGSWWGGNPQTKKQEEVDIVAKGFQEDELFLGECKWRNESVKISSLETLLARGNLFSQSQKYYYLFSKVKFSEQVKQYASEHGLRLVAFSQMF